jgi:hypothetical protein
MHKLAVITLAMLLFGTVAMAGSINSNPDFKAAGAKAYTCKLPSGLYTKCNQWVFSKGWKLSQVPKNTSPFSQLTSEDGKMVNIRRPSSGAVALYDANWADTRSFAFFDIVDDETRWQAEIDELYLRELEPATVEQVVKIKSKGNYNLWACMAAKMVAPLVDDDIPFEGGISVNLERENASGVPTELVSIPEKAMFGVGNAFERDSVGVKWVDDISQIPPTKRRDVYGLREPRNTLVDDGNGLDYINADAWTFPGSWIDGYQGHAGLRTAYRYHTERDNTTEAIWTCHDKTVALSPGMYRIKAIANPSVISYVYNYTDHEGFAAIRTILLRKVK